MTQRTVIVSFLVTALVLTVGTLWYQYQQIDTEKTVKEAVLSGMTAEVQTLERLKLEAQQEKQRLEIARLQDKKHAIPFQRDVKTAVTVGVCVTAALSGLIVSVAVYKKKTVHIFRLKDAEIPIKDRDLSKLAPEVSTGLVLAEQIEARAPEKAFQLYVKMAEMNTRQISALVGRRGLSGRLALDQQSAQALPAGPVIVPTFSDLLRAGDIAPGKPLIFGYRRDTGQPETGPLADQYSCVIIGLSGFGKTTFLAYNIASAVYAYQATFDVLDLHYPHPESLGATLGALVDTPYITILDNPMFLPDLIQAYHHELQRRLSAPTRHYTPRILVVDEHERWSKNSELVKLETKIVNEGRKVGMYLYLTSKSAKADKIGDSALRDNCVTSYVFKTKPQNARTFYQDKEKEQLVKELKAPGEAVFTNVRDDSCVLKVPYARLEDMHTVYDLVTEGNTIRERGAHPITRTSEGDTFFTPVTRSQRPGAVQMSERYADTSVTATPGETKIDSEPHVKGCLTPERIKEIREAQNLSQGKLGELIGLTQKEVSRVERGEKDITPEIRQALMTVFFQEEMSNVIPFRKSV